MFRRVFKRIFRKNPSPKKQLKIDFPELFRKKDSSLLIQHGLNAKVLKENGWSLSSLIGFGFRPKQIIALGFEKQDFLSRDCGFQAMNYRQDGITARFLVRKLGFTEEELKRRYFDKEEIAEAFRK